MFNAFPSYKPPSQNIFTPPVNYSNLWENFLGGRNSLFLPPPLPPPFAHCLLTTYLTYTHTLSLFIHLLSLTHTLSPFNASTLSLFLSLSLIHNHSLTHTLKFYHSLSLFHTHVIPLCLYLVVPLCACQALIRSRR